MRLVEEQVQPGFMRHTIGLPVTAPLAVMGDLRHDHRPDLIEVVHIEDVAGQIQVAAHLALPPIDDHDLGAHQAQHITQHLEDQNHADYDPQVRQKRRLNRRIRALQRQHAHDDEHDTQGKAKNDAGERANRPERRVLPLQTEINRPQPPLSYFQG